MLFVAPGQVYNCAEPWWGTTPIIPLCEHIRSEIAPNPGGVMQYVPIHVVLIAPNPGGVECKGSVGSVVAKPTILLLSLGFPPTRSFSYGRVCVNKVEWGQNFPP
jgi:hypothetical protein